MAPWYHGAHGTIVPWCHGTMVPWYHGTMVPWHHGAMVPWYSSILNRQSSILNHQSSIIHNQLSISNYQSAITSHHGTKSWPRCCLADFGFRITISAHPLGRSTSFFEPDLFRLVPGCGGWAEMRPMAKPPCPPAVGARRGPWLGSRWGNHFHLQLRNCPS